MILHILVVVMPSAYVLVTVEIGKVQQVNILLREIKELKEIYSLYGVYDIIAKVEADDMETLKDLVGSRIRQIDGIRATTTMILM